MARFARLFVSLIIAAAAAGCAGSPPPSTATPPPPSAVSTAAGATAPPSALATSTAAVATSPPATLPPTVAPTVAPVTARPSPAVGTAQVKLTFSGTRSFTAIGTAGHCPVSEPDGTLPFFNFDASESDYPGLGESFSLAQGVPGYVDVKWLISPAAGYARPGPAQGGSDSDIVESADHHTVTLDVELAPFGASGPMHVAGTVTCP